MMIEPSPGHLSFCLELFGRDNPSIWRATHDKGWSRHIHWILSNPKLTPYRKDPTEANWKLKEIIADAFFCRVFGEWIVLTQRPVYIEVSLTGIAGLKSLYCYNWSPFKGSSQKRILGKSRITINDRIDFRLRFCKRKKDHSQCWD